MQPLLAIRPSRAGLSVFACYDQLWHEIQALLAENEELARMVNLIKEHQQLRHLLRSHPSIQPLFTSTPRDGPGDLTGGTAGSSSRGPRPCPLTPQGVPPLAGRGREVLGARGTGLGAAGTESAVSVSAAVPVNMYANPFIGDNFLQYSCPVELQGSFTLPPERQQPPERPPDPRTPEQRSPSVQNLQSPGPTVTPMPVTPVPVTPIPATPVPATPIPATPIPVTPIPVTPVPVTPVPVTPVAPVPPEPLSPAQQQQPLDLRLPDVRRKEPSRKMPRAAERPPATPQTPQGASHRGTDRVWGSEHAAPPQDPHRPGSSVRVGSAGGGSPSYPTYHTLQVPSFPSPWGNPTCGQPQAPRSRGGGPGVRGSRAPPADARHSERLVGEIAFQLDRRILANIFPDRPRLYGFTVTNIPEKIMGSIFGSTPGAFDEQHCAAMARRYFTLMTRLRALGYNPEVHPALAESLVNTFGILRELPEGDGSDARAAPSPSHLRRVVSETVSPALRADALVLLECLQELAREDGKPLFLS
uniref:Spermatogenesis and centriole associated 1 n=1 Tax=Cairina moschata TaxID=8855 RepID=A0A8C3GP31_CAIMO